MKRSLKPWYRKSVGAWYVQHERKQVRPCNGEEGEKEAMRRWHLLMAGEKPTPEEPATDRPAPTPIAVPTLTLKPLA